MYFKIQHFLFARITRVKLDGILSKKVVGGVLSPTLFLIYINYIFTTIPKKGLKHTTCRRQSGLRLSTPPLQSTGHNWTLGCGFEINISKTNSTLFPISSSKEQIKLRLKNEIVPQTDTTTFVGVKLDTRLA